MITLPVTTDQSTYSLINTPVTGFNPIYLWWKTAWSMSCWSKHQSTPKNVIIHYAPTLSGSLKMSAVGPKSSMKSAKYWMSLRASSALDRGVFTPSNWSPRWTTLVATLLIRSSSSWKWRKASCIHQGEKIIRECMGLICESTKGKRYYSCDIDRFGEISIYQSLKQPCIIKPPLYSLSKGVSTIHIYSHKLHFTSKVQLRDDIPLKTHVLWNLLTQIIKCGTSHFVTKTYSVWGDKNPLLWNE